MKILRIDKIWLDIVLFIVLIVIVFIGGNGKYDVMPSKLGEHISLSQQENILQSFFPLKGNVDEIILYGKNIKNKKGKVDVRVFDDDSNIYFNGGVFIDNNLLDIKLNRFLKRSENRQFYIEIKNCNNLFLMCATDNEYKDNHLFIGGTEVNKDLAITVYYKNILPWVYLIVLIVIFLMFIYLRSIKGEEKGNEKEIDYISCIRVLATCGVFITHFAPAIPLGDNVIKYTAFLSHGVEIFFIISAYGIFCSLERYVSIKKFYLKRIFRIVPLYYTIVVILIMYFLVANMDIPNDSSNLYWLRYFTFTTTSIPTDNSFWINLCATWTIPCFMFFYLIAPFLWKFINSWKKSLCFFGLTFIMGEVIIVNFYHHLIGMNEICWDNLESANPIRYLWIFAIGMIIYYAEKEHKVSQSIILGIGLQFIVFLYYYYGGSVGRTRIDVSLFASLMILLLLDKKIKNKYMAKLIGKVEPYTYAIYLVHPLIFIVLEKYRVYARNKIVFAVFLAYMVIIVVYLLNKVVEQNSMKLCNYIEKRL